ncbi:hypothetical protein O1611_g9726 [Lasiodiplodia mahajangana]|uniref:Uncharacterized protein n=1 Tax=Lasiodiplodia mahajangana TaxID=1108764 RepID=A0ACC2J632_9PEZI|nr:hypothetical protein O1611_g9726 [Lasiodiplodia mahajangana]
MVVYFRQNFHVLGELAMGDISFDVICKRCAGVYVAIDENSSPLVADITTFHSTIKEILVSSKSCHLCSIIIGVLHNNARLEKDMSTLLKMDTNNDISVRMSPGTIICVLHDLANRPKELSKLLEIDTNECILLSMSPRDDHINVGYGILRVSRRHTVADLRGRPTHRLMTPKTCAQLLKKWIDMCENGHRFHLKCLSSQYAGNQLPTRLMEVMPGQGSQPPTVCLIKADGLPRTTRYATLSYRWGGNIPSKTTTETYEAYMEKVPFESLPGTIRDSVLLVYELGIKYLWVDSFCIIQDDRDDWKQESSRMASVYANGFLNIAADVPHDAGGGLYTMRNPLRFAACRVGSFTIFRDEFEDAKFNTRPLYTRGWTHQERYLSARTVHFGYQQISWECASCNLMEGFPIDGIRSKRDVNIPAILRTTHKDKS